MRCKKRSTFVILPRLFLYFAYTRAITLLKSFEYAASNLYVEYSVENRDDPAARSDLVRFQFIRTWFARMPVRTVSIGNPTVRSSVNAKVSR